MSVLNRLKIVSSKNNNMTNKLPPKLLKRMYKLTEGIHMQYYAANYAKDYPEAADLKELERLAEEINGVKEQLEKINAGAEILAMQPGKSKK